MRPPRFFIISKYHLAYKFAYAHSFFLGCSACTQKETSSQAEVSVTYPRDSDRLSAHGSSLLRGGPAETNGALHARSSPQSESLDLRGAAMCSNAQGTIHRLTVAGEVRCFSTLLSPSAVRPAPILIMHHGATGGAWQFCSGPFAQQAADSGLALVCTEAVGGNWRFGDPNTCLAAAGDADLVYTARVVGVLEADPKAYDARRIFHVGFSQGALVRTAKRSSQHQPLVLST